MIIEKILLLGGSGFIGTAVAEQLCNRGYAVTVPTRRIARGRHLLVLPTVDVIDADVHDRAVLRELIGHHDAVINLVGILAGDFEREHHALPKLIAECCVAAGVNRFIQMSALNADVNGPSEYLASRGRGEAAVWAVAKANPSLQVTIFQPSVVFGEHDKFINMFAEMAKLLPLIPLGTPDAQFQPVWVEDVARAIAGSVAMPETAGKTYPLVGPRVYTLRELLNLVSALSGSHCTVIGLGKSMSAWQASVFERLPGKLITRDNLRSMSIPSTSATPFPHIFGSATAMENVIGSYLHGASGPGRARYQAFRDGAGR